MLVENQKNNLIIFFGPVLKLVLSHFEGSPKTGPLKILLIWFNCTCR